MKIRFISQQAATTAAATGRLGDRLRKMNKRLLDVSEAAKIELEAATMTRAGTAGYDVRLLGLLRALKSEARENRRRMNEIDDLLQDIFAASEEQADAMPEPFNHRRH